MNLVILSIAILAGLGIVSAVVLFLTSKRFHEKESCFPALQFGFFAVYCS